MSATALIGIFGVILFLVLLCFKIPISYSMLVVGFLGFSYLVSPSAAFSMVSNEIFSIFTSYSLSVILMFVWMGFIAYYSGIGSSLYRFAYKMIGHKPGGLAIATQVACAMFGSICGSNTATAATMGAIALPEMKKYKYSDSLSTASVAAGGALGVLIPPSVIFIIYGINTTQSIGKLFIAGIVPGILLMTLYMITVYLIVLKNPKLGPAGEKSTWKERFYALRGGVWEMGLTFIISLGGLFRGWFSPSEAGAVGVAILLFLTVIQRKIKWHGFVKSITDTTRTTAMIMLMVASATVFGKFISVSRLPTDIAQWASELALPAFMVMGIILLIYFILGCFIDALALILLTIPIFYPVAVDVLGYDPIWFGVIIVIVVATGVITPPIGMNVFIIKGVSKDIPLETIYKGVWPFLIAIAVCLSLLMIFPELVTFLPKYFTY